MYICICKAVTDQQLKQALTEGCASKRALCAKFGVGSQCGRCAPTLRELLDEHLALPEALAKENQTSAA